MKKVKVWTCMCERASYAIILSGTGVWRTCLKASAMARNSPKQKLQSLQDLLQPYSVEKIFGTSADGTFF